MKIALLKDIAAPYRIPLFNELAGRPGTELRLLLASRNDPRRDYPFYADEFRFEHRVLPGFELRRDLRWVVFNRGLSRELARFAPDVLIVGGWAQPVFWQGILWARRHDVPLVLWVESTTRDERSGAGPLEAAKRFAVRSAAGFLVPGRAAAEYVESFGVDPSLIEIAPNAVDLSIFSEQVTQCYERRAELRSARGLDGCVFVCVSRLSPEKGVDVLVRAFEGVPGTLVAIGDGPQEAGLRASAPPNVRLVGRVERDDLPGWYAAADAFVMPSRSETWGMAMSEAAAAGLPVVATEAPGAAYELVEEGVNGFRVPVDDENALRQALTRVAEDPAWREAARVRTLELAAGFTPEAWADAVERLVQRLLSASV
jgi:glycosyltransferase involved in cell wall biosynthesis